MGTYVVRRVLGMIPMVFLITVFVFLIMHAAPGNAFDAIMNPAIKDIEQLKEQLEHNAGLDQPLWWQYVHWLGLFVTGNWGFSFTHHVPVTQLVGPAIRNTLILGILAEVLTIALGVPFGILQARNPYGKFDYTSNIVLFCLYSVPFFVFAIFMIYFFAIDLQWFPAQGSTGTGANAGSLGDHLYHALLPALSLAFVNSTIYSRYTRGSMLDVSRKDYVRTARAKGLEEGRVFTKHVFRNGMIPIVTQFGLDFGNMVGGLIITEGIFQYQGMGQLVIDAVNGRDYNVIMATTVLIAIGVLIGNLLADILYAVVDPRIRYD
ncbi:ABC transporter permease [Alicyclobacillus macrosporangiidus]|uniref:ABC transporter permease n=1 Tax=Alicyclobacillus macrosporangiidus TaxID=392015 RepID=UPI000495566F|nr:ABC transporter permease [Alicyclobacillus macrosporangiidus]